MQKYYGKERGAQRRTRELEEPDKIASVTDPLTGQAADRAAERTDHRHSPADEWAADGPVGRTAGLGHLRECTDPVATERRDQDTHPETAAP